MMTPLNNEMEREVRKRESREGYLSPVDKLSIKVEMLTKELERHRNR